MRHLLAVTMVMAACSTWACGGAGTFDPKGVTSMVSRVERIERAYAADLLKAKTAEQIEAARHKNREALREAENILSMYYRLGPGEELLKCDVAREAASAAVHRERDRRRAVQK